MGFIGTAFTRRGARSAVALSATLALLAAGGSSASAAALATAPHNPASVRAGTAVAAIKAFPSGGKGSASESTCYAYTLLLQQDQNSVEWANQVGVDDGSQAQLDRHAGAAMDAGCAVIY